MNQRWRLIALWLLPLAVVAFLGWQLLGNGGTARFKPEGATVAPRNAAVARMSYGRFLDYVEAGRVTAVDIFDGGRTAVVEAVDPDLDNRVQRLRVDLPGLAPELVNNLKQQGISFGQRSYVPGSGNRVAAMLAGQANATILDLSNRNKIIAEAGDKFNSLPMFEVKASDEALFANLDWIKENEAAVNTLVTALHSTWADMSQDPTIISKQTDPNGPIGQLPAEVLAELDGFYTAAVAGGLYDPNGGGREAAAADMEWYSEAGQLDGDPSTLNADDFWYFAPLDAAMQ